MAVSTVARFFIMQIIATNLCIWLLTVVLEATEEISHHDYEGLYAEILFVRGPVPHTRTAGNFWCNSGTRSTPREPWTTLPLKQ